MRQFSLPRACWITVAMLLAGLLSPPVPSLAGETLQLVGQARVIDNVTLEIWGQRIRLAGITAPDPHTTQGRNGKRYLEHLVDAVTVRCEADGPLFGIEAPGRCFAGGVDIAASLVEFGHARRMLQQSDINSN